MSRSGILSSLRNAFWYRLALGFALALVSVASLHAQFTYTDLHEFSCGVGDGCYPNDYGQLSQGADGNLYGTAWGGGTNGAGTIFMITPSGTEAVLYDFDGPHGSNPDGGLTLASDW
ncbi:MAG: choice-of-anchor tandem repeat GloVer-containing protein, partial [Terriglobales bacterium]